MKERKRGVKFPARLTVTVLLILLQLFIFFFMIYSLSEHCFWFYLLIEFLSAVLSVSIINNRSDPANKTLWIILILAVPFIGVPAYLLWGGGRVRPRLRKRMDECEKRYESALTRDTYAEGRLREEDPALYRKARYLINETGFPLYCATETEYLSPGEEALPKILDELRGAKEFILLEFFILAEGKMWNEIHEILRERASDGVEVRLIFDDFGSVNRQNKNFIKNLRAEGIEAAVFNPLRPSLDLFMNNRDHRKILVIDGRVALTGGMNIADEYVNYERRFGYWMDCAALFRGDAVRSFTVMFLSMWNYVTGRALPAERYLKDAKSEYDGYVLPYCDSPLNDKNPAEGIYMQMISGAMKYIYITTPYLIIDNAMIAALSLSAKSGVDVRIVTPRVHDKWYVHPVTRKNYQALLDAGVKIYEFTPGFIHSKLFVTDDSCATVGTVNMDYRSFFIHFECGAFICRSDAVFDIRDHILSIIEQSERIKPEEWKKRPKRQKAIEQVLSVFSPFM